MAKIITKGGITPEDLKKLQEMLEKEKQKIK